MVRLKYEAISEATTALLKLGYVAGQWFQAHQQTFNKLAESEKNQGVATAHSKSRSQP